LLLLIPLASSSFHAIPNVVITVVTVVISSDHSSHFITVDCCLYNHLYLGVGSAVIAAPMPLLLPCHFYPLQCFHQPGVLMMQVTTTRKQLDNNKNQP
jgi:hypothetical protein